MELTNHWCSRNGVPIVRQLLANHIARRNDATLGAKFNLLIAADTFNYKAADFNCYSFLEERESLKKMTFRTIVAEHNRRIGKFLKYLTFLKAMLITQLLTIIIIVLCYPTNSHWWSGRRKEDHCLW